MILIYLQRPFDTINHEILLGKLNAIGFSQKAVAWFNRVYQIEHSNRSV